MNRKKLILALLFLTPGILYTLLWGKIIAPLFPAQQYVRDRLYHLLMQASIQKRMPIDESDRRFLGEAIKILVHASIITWIAVIVFSI